MANKQSNWNKIINGDYEDFLQGGRVGNREGYTTVSQIDTSNNPQPTQSREEELNSGFNDYLYRLNHPIYALTKLPETAQKAVEAGKNFFSQSFFKQGEGDVLQNIGGTLADTGINVTKGLLNYAEDIADFGVYKIADLAELTGNKVTAEGLRSYADVRAVKALFGENEKNTENIFTRNIDNEGNMEASFHEKLDKYSYFDKGMDDVAQGVGQLFGTIGTTELIGKTGLTKGFENTLTKHGVKAKVAQDYAKSLNTALSSYSSAYGGTYGNMRRLGYSDEEAKTQARISGLVEAISEQLHDGIPGTKTAGWADKINKSKNPALQAILNSLGEVDEEVFGEILTMIINDVRFNLDPDNPYLQDNIQYSGDILKDIYDDVLSDDAKSKYLTVFLSTLITNGMSEVNTSLERRKNAKQNPLLKTENLNQGQPIEQVKSQPETKIEQKVQNVPQVAEEQPVKQTKKTQQEVDELHNSDSFRRRTMKEIQSLVSEEEYNDLLNTINERDMSDERLQEYLDDIKGITKEEREAQNIIDSNNYRRNTMKEIQNLVSKEEYNDLLQRIGERDMSDEELGNYLEKVKENTDVKKQQLEIINKTNPMTDEYHTGIRNIKDIKTFKEAYNEAINNGYENYSSYPDVKNEVLNEAIQNNTIRVYSSKPIENGVFVSPSLSMAKDYAGDGKTYFKDVNLDDVAWIDIDQGQYAKIENKINKEPKKATAVQKTKPTTQPAKQVKQEQSTRDTANETIPQDTLSIALKERKFYDSVIKSENTTEQAKKISKKLTGMDMYAPDSNNAELSRADEYINEHGIEDSLKMLREVTESSRNNVDDVAIGNRLIEYFSKTGDEQGLEEAIQLTAMAGTNVGRAVQAMSLIGRQTPAGQATWIERCVNKLNKQMEEQFNKSHSPFKKKQEFKFTTEMKQKIINSTEANLEQNINEVYQELGNQVQMSILEAIDSWRYFSMLSSPTTHLRNIIGNLTMGGIQGIKDKIAGGIEDLYYGISGKQGERTKTFGKANKEYYNFATEDLKNDVVKTKLGYGSNKYTNPKSQLEQNKRMFSDTKVGRFLEKTIKKGAIDTTSRALEAEDIGTIKIKGKEYNITGLSRNYINSMAQYLYANKIDLKNITQQQLNQARAYAIEAAKQATFHQESALATLLTTFENKNLATKVIVGGIVPFKKTPFNVAKTALSYNPVGLLWTITHDSVQLYNGKINANQYIDNLAKGLTGTGIAVVGYVLASMGLIRTSGKDDEQYESDKGVQPYSFSIGDKTISLDWLSPTAVPLFVGAELYNQVNSMNNDLPENEKDQVVRNGFLNLLNAGVSSLNPVSEMTMLSGIQSALKTYSGDYSKALEEIGTNTIKTYVNQLTPSLLGKIAKSTDEYERSTTSTSKTTVGKTIDTIVNQTKSKIPGLRQTLPKKTDVWGNEVKQNENPLLRTTYNLLSPATVKDVRETALDKEISRLYESTGEKSVLPKTYIDKYFTYNNKEYRLTQDEYAAYKQILGKNNYEILSNLIKSSDYKKLNDEEKAKLISQVYTYDKNVNKEAYAKINKINYTPDSTYYAQKKSTMLGGTIDDYLIYKLQDFKADKDEEGNSISGTKKAKVVDYLNDVDMDYNQKLYLFAKDYALSPQEKTYIAELINTSNLSVEDKLALYKDLTGFKVSSDGTVRW